MDRLEPAIGNSGNPDTFQINFDIHLKHFKSMIFSAQMQGWGLLCLYLRRKQFKKRIKPIMRISILIIIILSSGLQLIFATTIKGQDMTIEKVSVGLNSEPITNGIKQIEQQTSLRFFYQKLALRQLNRVSLISARRTVEQTLNQLFQNTNFSFRQIDQSILIKENTNVPQLKRKISGTVFTQDTKAPLRFASVQLIRKADFQTVGQGETDQTGHFELSATDSSAQIIRVSLIGYRIYSKELDVKQDVVLSNIYLEPDAKELKEIIVSARSPLIKQEVDRLSYNVQSDPDSKGSNLLDILRKVPLVTVDADDNIKVKGSSSFRVLIDGHASSLVVNNPKDIFRSMSSANILRIEVITIPPAKYDSEGLAGILNVITMKAKIDGYNAGLGTSYKFPNGLRTNANLNFKSGNFSLSSYGGWNEYNTPLTNFSNFRQSIFSSAYTYQDGMAKTRSNQGFASNQVSYEIDSLNLLSAVANYNGGKGHRLGSVITSQHDNILQQYRIDNDGHNNQEAYELGLDYQKGFKRSKNQLLSFSYRFSNAQSKQRNDLRALELLNIAIGNFDQQNTTKLNEHTAQIDYVQPYQILTVEAGAKAIYRDTRSDFTSVGIDPISGNPFSVSNSDNFYYGQDILSLYNSYQLNLKRWTLKAGLRLERTGVKADFSNSGKANIPDYTNLIPSVAIQRKLTQTANLNFGYTERILRPGILQLNPYVDRQNPYFIAFGNPLLKPELNHTLSVNFSSYQKFGITTGLGYSFSNNTIQYVSTLGLDGITSGTYENLGSNKSIDFNVNVNYPITQKLSLSLNAQAGYLKLKGIVNQLLYTRNAFTGSAILILNYNLGHDWRPTFNFQYYSPSITLQGTSSPYYYSSLGISKSFNKKIFISGSFSNPYLKYLDYKINYTDPRFTQLTHNDIVYRRFNLGISYQFGKLRDGSIKKNKKTVQNDDIKVIKSIIPAN
jgi:hypothetical protein